MKERGHIHLNANDQWLGRSKKQLYDHNVHYNKQHNIFDYEYQRNRIALPEEQVQNIQKKHTHNIPETSFIHKSPIKDKIFKSYVEDGALIKTNEHDPRKVTAAHGIPTAGISTNFGVIPDPPKFESG